MTVPQTQLAKVCALLNAEGVRYVVCGARALQLWGSSRFTKDIDILIEPTVENATRVIAALSQIGFGLASEWLPEEIANKKVTIIGDTPRVDILTVAWSVHYRDAGPAATVITHDGIPIPTISLEHLIASKRTGRLQDAADIEVIEEIQRRLSRGS